MIFRPIRRYHWENVSLRAGLALLALVMTFSSWAQAQAYLPAMGGGGGGQFQAPCPSGQNLTGFELRAGDDVDAIRPVCVTAYGRSEVTAPALTADSGLVRTPGSLVGALQVAPGWYGGPGGGIQRVLCPASKPIVIGMDVASEGDNDITINNIHLFCGVAISAGQSAAGAPSAIFAAPFRWPRIEETRRWESQRCPGGQVAVGVHGRAGKYLDAMGLICDPARIAPLPAGSAKRVVKAMGRAKLEATADPPISICEAARQARERNSPAAAGLEAQCRAQTPAVKGVGRVKLSPPSGPPIPICDAAGAARDRNSPAAAGLEAECLALGGHLPASATGVALTVDQLAAKGAIIAAGDRSSAWLRDLQPDGPIRRGFDIGMAAAEGQTEWGPGKQKMLDSLTPAQQEGFKVATSFSLDRNRNAEIAATGAAIADADPTVAAARFGEVDIDLRYWLGFDIATGIFGDPALGAKGNTATGPGSLKIRDALSAPAQRGFNASVAFHLSRSYAK